MSTVLTLTVTEEQLRKFARLIYEHTGIQISPQKKALLSNRLRRRLRATGLSSFDAYFDTLASTDVSDPEWDAFLEEITTHETFLFRDPAQWDWFAESFLPEIQAEARKGMRPRRLRIWSAACSSGDEPVTMACCIADKMLTVSDWQIEILATDIGAATLEKAQATTFGARAMRNVSETLRRRWFVQNAPERWAAKPHLRKWITFRQHNLLDPLPAAPFDLIVVKNVLIYFDAASKQRVFDNVDRALKPGGLLMTGAAEGISELLKHYERRHPWLHRKTSNSDAQPSTHPGGNADGHQ